MSGLSGVSSQGVGHDIVSYLQEVAAFFGITIRVTSGYRDPEAQARAMFGNWAKMKHGKIYKKNVLPEADRIQLDAYWTTAHSSKASGQDKRTAQADFLKLAEAKVGSKSMHTRGRAIDVSRSLIDQNVYRAITMHLHEVKEGNRMDIYHFESLPVVPAVDEAMRASWKNLENGAHHPHSPPHLAHGCWC